MDKAKIEDVTVLLIGAAHNSLLENIRNEQAFDLQKLFDRKEKEKMQEHGRSSFDLS